MRRLAWLPFLLAWIWAPDLAALELAGRFEQGGLVQGRVAPGSRVFVAGRTVRVTEDGVFVFGFGRDHGPEITVEAVTPSGERQRKTIAVAKRQYAIQRIDGLPKKMVTPPKAVWDRIKRENARIAKVRRQDSSMPWFRSGWVWPVRGIVSGVFGSQRVLNGKPKRPHYGIDIAAPTGTPVVAPADGVVAMAEPDLYYTGGTVMLDHGHGLTSVYSHLEKVTVAVGEVVRQGEAIGTVGASGRATGAHLDWRLNWFKERLDPALLVGPMPQ